jgi:haloalkane dehalogenase
MCSATATSASRTLQEVTVVVQDWGGPIGLRWAVEHTDQVGRLVALNTGLFTGRVSKGFMGWREFAEKTPDLPIGMIMQGATTTDLAPEIVAAYEAPFPTPESKAGAAQFPLLVPLTPEETGAAEMISVKHALSWWDKRTLVAFSDSDPVFPWAADLLHRLDAIPAAQLAAGDSAVLRPGVAS